MLAGSFIALGAHSRNIRPTIRDHPPKEAAPPAGAGGPSFLHQAPTITDSMKSHLKAPSALLRDQFIAGGGPGHCGGRADALTRGAHGR
jgi:hypothetical protein